MEIVWTPKVEVKTKDTITIVDDRCFKKDVALIFKSIDGTVSNVKTTKPPATTAKTSKTLTGKLKIKSPSPPQGLLRHAMLANKAAKVKPMTKSTGATIPKVTSHQMPLGELNIFNEQNKPTAVHGKENRTPARSSPPLSVTDLFDDIQFTPVNRQKTANQPKVNLANVDDIDYMASLPTPVTTKPSYNHTYAVGRNPSDTMEITSFEPNIASTIDRVTSAEPKQLDVDTDPRRKLFDVTTRSENMMPTATVPVFNVTHTIRPALSLTNIKEEPDVSCTVQDTFQMPRNSQLSSDTLHKKFQSMRNLDDMSTTQKLLRDNLGSMPNLCDSQLVQSIESNRYFYQNVDTGSANDPRNQSGASSVFGGSVMSFAENDILAQSSRFDLDKLHGMDFPITTETTARRREFAVPKPYDPSKRTGDDEHQKRKPTPKCSPPKRAKLDCSATSSVSSVRSARRSTNWAGIKPKKFPYIPKLNLTRQRPEEEEEERVVFFDPEHHFKS